MSDGKENMESETTLGNAVNANDVSLESDKGLDPHQLDLVSSRAKLTVAGLLSFIGDPVGKGLNKGLSPVGKLVGGVAQPFGSGKSNTDKLQGNTKEDDSLKRIGGQEQTGQNPLGL